jgi:hypothetical protein
MAAVSHRLLARTRPRAACNGRFGRRRREQAGGLDIVKCAEGRHTPRVLTDLHELVADFTEVAAKVGLAGWPCEVASEFVPAPHRPPRLPVGYGAVYVFALSAESGARVPAGPGAGLKVGRVGPKSAARFTSQHYLPSSAHSTLAGSLLTYPVLWPWLGIKKLDAESVKPWMLESLDRAHLYVAAAAVPILPQLEVYVRARVGSIFEGAA